MAITQKDYNTLSQRCAQMLLLLHGGDKTASKARAATCLAGLKGALLPGSPDAVTAIRSTAYPLTPQGVSRAIDDVAWACFLADVAAAVDAG
jgi:hypothetical protein